MIFNSLEFAIFLPLVFILYWFIAQKSLRGQNALIVVASYFFYGWWDWRFLFLVAFSSMADYLIALAMGRSDNNRKRKSLLFLSISINLGLLGFFKYFNFFVDNFVEAFTLFGGRLNVQTLKILLPVGISFYTFQTLSYTIDVYRKKMEPTKEIISFFAFVSFFPQLVAGPIERATSLLPQFYKKRTFRYDEAVDGMRQILWGLFKKIVVADNCAKFANLIFNDSGNYSGSTLALGAIFFTFQIYCDFSGYSDIAIGTSRLFGFKLMQNFATPYFSRDIAEFWRRWHISLSTWFRDYVYIPLGGSRGGTAMKIRNTFIIFLVSGFWHGANWTFLIWGALNAVYFLPLLLTESNRNHLDVVAKGKILPSLNELALMTGTFILTVLAWVFFRAENLSHAITYLSEIISPSIFRMPHFADRGNAVVVILLILFLLIVEWQGRERQYAIEQLGQKWPRLLRWSFYSFLISLMGMFMVSEESPFIYFQF